MGKSSPPTKACGAATPGKRQHPSALLAAIRQDAAGRSSAAEVFIGLPAVYVEAVISAFWMTAMEGAALDWPPVLRLCSWADGQADAELQAPQNDAWREWRGTRMASLRLLEAGFARIDHEIPADLGDQAWAIIETASEDPDPEPAAEAEARASGRSLSEFTMAHIRPQALTTAVAYAAWARRGNPEAGLGTVQQLIENQLKPALEPSPAIRWVCGVSFGVLTRLFRPWAIEKAPTIFPAREAERHLWTAAWDGYLTLRPVLDMCEVLDGSYQLSVDLMNPASTEREELARANNLGLNLLIRYWHGQLTFENYNQLLRRYYRSAPASVRASLMNFMGRGSPPQIPFQRNCSFASGKSGSRPCAMAPTQGSWQASANGSQQESSERIGNYASSSQRSRTAGRLSSSTWFFPGSPRSLRHTPTHAW